ncbi:MAG: bifunctional lysylphosphatidylglycerol synthetase/lysine--tRNA ligase LysX, partial [Cutibacterium acnes]
MNIAALLIVLRLVFSRTTWVAIANNVFSLFIFPVDGFGWAGVVVLLVLSDALSRRKRFAWWVSLVVFGLMWLVAAAFFIIVVTEVFIGWPTDTLNDVDLAGYLFNVFSVGWILVALLTHRRDFAAHTVRANLGRAVVVLVGGLLATGFIGWLLVSLTGGVGRPRNRLVHIITRILQGSGAGIAQEPTSPHWVQGVVSFLLAVVLVAALVVILRSQRNIAMMSLSDELRLRRLLDENPADSLGYFALRRDKAVVFSRNGHAAVCYRTEAGVALASGDPVGPVDQWPGAIDAFLEVAHTYGWVPAVVGTSEEGATTWNQAGLRAMRIGDEAIISPATFNLDDPDLKPVRHTVTKLRAMGYTTRVRRHEDINPQELHSLIDLTDKWRQNGDERGFSMALSRLGDPLDGRCVMVEAIYPDDGPRAGQTAGILSFTPWGNDGLSLDVMRRDLDGADNGVTELMVAGLMAAGPEIGIRRVSMNFAVFREAIEEGARVGASPVRRLNRWLVLVASKWFQIEQLYRSNVKYKPSWQTRYLNFTDTSDLAQVGLAMGIAEGQLDIPNWLYPVEPPPQPIYSISGHPEIAEFLAEERAPILPQRRLPEQVRTRMATRERLIESGVEAYPPDCKPDHRLGDVAVELTGQEMTVSGRVDACRDHGGVIFVDLFDWTGACQLVMERDTMGVDSLRDFRHAVSLG